MADTVLLLGPNATTYSPTTFSVDSYTQITATFANTVPAGTYAVQVTTGTATATLQSALTLTMGGKAQLETHLVLPSALGRHATATLYLQYANLGTVAMQAPLLILSNPNNDRPLLTLDKSKLVSGFYTGGIPDGFSTTLEILASGATPGLLQPGESVTVPIYYGGLEQPWNFSHTTVPINLHVVYATDITPVDWPSMASSLQPSGIDSATWSAI